MQPGNTSGTGHPHSYTVSYPYPDTGPHAHINPPPPPNPLAHTDTHPNCDPYAPTHAYSHTPGDHGPGCRSRSMGTSEALLQGAVPEPP